MNDNNPNNNPENLFGADQYIDFRPITDGLGFNHQKNQPQKKSTAPAHSGLSYSLERAQVKPAQELYQKEMMDFHAKLKMANEANQKSKPIENNTKLASLEEKAGSLIFDLALLFSTVSLSLVFVSALTQEPLFYQLGNLHMMTWIVFVTLFSFYYIGYFSITEKYLGATVGQSILKLQTDDQDQKKPLVLFFMKSLLGLLSVLTFGISAIMDLPTRMTDIKVLKRS